LKGRVGFILTEDPRLTDVLVEGPSLRLAMDGDRVRAQVTSSPNAPRRIGVITEVVEHARDTLVGVFSMRQEISYLVPEEGTPPVRLTDLRNLHPKENDLIVARVTLWPTLERPASAVLAEVLGARDTPGVDLKRLTRKYALVDVFPPEAEAEAAAWSEEVPFALYQLRETYFDRRVFTIDGADAKDFDDAVSLERLEGGLWRLGVHIADVSQYVAPSTALDAEALRRGTSVYLSGTVVPMLPFALSDGLCSLRPHCVRLTLSCVMDVDPEGRVVAHRIFESAIRSAKRFTYEEVEDILQGRELSGLAPEIHGDVREMGRLARLLRRKRFERGSLDFDFPEPDVVMGPDGWPVDIRQRSRLESHRLVEDFMLLANETVAQHMKDRPFLYRIHEAPDPLKLEKLRKTLEASGVPIPRAFDEGHPAALQQIIQYCSGKPIQPMVQTMILRSLKQAVYSTLHAGHFGLASSCYTHFTSPIRRYPDLIVHRLVKDRLQQRPPPYDVKALQTIAELSSRRERIAVDAEREYFDVQKARLMKQHVGESFDGVISGVTAFGIFVQLAEYFVEGLVHISHLRGDYYVYDELRMTLSGQRSGRSYRMGQTVRVQLAAANIEKRQLDFELVEEKATSAAPDRPERTRQRRGGRSQGYRRSAGQR